MSTLKVGAIQSTTGNAAITVAANGAISMPVNHMCETWMITADHDDSGDLTANWAKNTGRGTSDLGSISMTQSSGIFTFPSTGHYSIEFILGSIISDGSDDTITAAIKSTTDGTNYNPISRGKTGTEPGGYKTSCIVRCVFHCTNTSTHKIKFNIDSFTGVLTGNANLLLTGAIFTKIA